MRSRRPSWFLVTATFASSLTLVFACRGGSTSTSSQASGPAEVGGNDASRSGSGGANGNNPNSNASAANGPNGTEGDAALPSRDPGAPAVRFIGRFDTREAAGPICGWPGCRIIANFRGTGVQARLEDRAESWMQGGPSEYDVIVDGVLQPKLVLALGAHDYPLASGLADAPHRIELYRRSETQTGYTQFLGYDFGGGTLLPPPLPALRRIEVVGDSQPAGFGIDGVGTGCPGPAWAAKFEDFHKSLSARLGELLDADLNGTAYSGKGFVRNIARTDTETMPVLYPRTNPIDATSVWDFSRFVPDVIVVMMGGNDFAIGQYVDAGPLPLVEFTAAVRGLVGTFRTHSPQAHVFLALSPSVTDSPTSTHGRTNVKSAFDTVASERAAAGDTRVYSVAPPVAVESELTGCDGHGNAAYHERVAQQLATMVKAQTGW
jgi:lysophospholipase L1-like esterase